MVREPKHELLLQSSSGSRASLHHLCLNCRRLGQISTYPGRYTQDRFISTSILHWDCSWSDTAGSRRVMNMNIRMTSCVYQRLHQILSEEMERTTP
jgi:hypothetical protein